MDDFKNRDFLSTMDMINAPISYLARLIGRKWFLTIEELAKRVRMSVATIGTVLRGGKISEEYAQRLRIFLENYKGE